MKKELKKLNRKDLLEIVLEQIKRIEKLENENENLNRKLESKTISIKESGSIAEASLKISNIFKSIEEAKEIYMENIKDLARKEANDIRNKIISNTKKRCREKEKLFNKRLKENETINA